MRTFKSLHERISVHNDLEGLDPMIYFGPFLDLIENPETPFLCVPTLTCRADLTQLALSSIDKFILYGLETRDVIRRLHNSSVESLCNHRNQPHGGCAMRLSV